MCLSRSSIRWAAVGAGPMDAGARGVDESSGGPLAGGGVAGLERMVDGRWQGGYKLGDDLSGRGEGESWLPQQQLLFGRQQSSGRRI